MNTEDRKWKARAEGLLDALHDAWCRGVGFDGLPAFDRTKPRKEQEEAFDRRFMPWKFDPPPVPLTEESVRAALPQIRDRFRRGA